MCVDVLRGGKRFDINFACVGGWLVLKLYVHVSTTFVGIVVHNISKSSTAALL